MLRYNCYYEKINGITKNINEEIPFDIPNNWTWARMKSVLDVRDGTHDSPKYLKNGIPFVTSKCLKEDKIDFSLCKFISLNDANEFNKRSLVEDKDILFAMIGTIGNPVIVNKDRDFAIKNVALIKNINIGLLSQIWVKYLLEFFAVKMKTTTSSGLQPFVSLDFLRNYIIPIPPYQEQIRLIELLSNIFDKIILVKKECDILANFIEQTKLKILDYYFGENSCYKSYYENVLLENVCKITMGQSVDGSSITKKQTLSSIEFHQGKIAFGDIYLKSSNKYTPAPKKIIDKNSVVICVRAPVGDINITDRSISIGRGLCGLSSNKVKLMYLYYYLLYKGSYFRSLSQGSTFASITIKTINKTPFLMCNDDLQNKIITHIQKAFDLIDKIKEQLI